MAEKIWCLSVSGGWEEVESNFFDELFSPITQQVHHENWSPFITSNDDNTQGITWYKNTKDGRSAFEISGVDELLYVMAIDLPSAISIWKDLSASSSNLNIERLNATLFKMFHAMHGHNAHEVCTRCDPDEVKLRKEARERYLKNKKQKDEKHEPL